MSRLRRRAFASAVASTLIAIAACSPQVWSLDVTLEFSSLSYYERNVHVFWAAPWTDFELGDAVTGVNRITAGSTVNPTLVTFTDENECPTAGTFQVIVWVPDCTVDPMRVGCAYDFECTAGLCTEPIETRPGDWIEFSEPFTAPCDFNEQHVAFDFVVP